MYRNPIVNPVLSQHCGNPSCDALLLRTYGNIRLPLVTVRCLVCGTDNELGRSPNTLRALVRQEGEPT